MLYEMSLESSEALNVKLVDCVITAVIWLTPLIDGDSLAVSNATNYKYSGKNNNKKWQAMGTVQNQILLSHKHRNRDIIDTRAHIYITADYPDTHMHNRWLPGHTYALPLTIRTHIYITVDYPDTHIHNRWLSWFGILCTDTAITMLRSWSSIWSQTFPLSEMMQLYKMFSLCYQNVYPHIWLSEQVVVKSVWHRSWHVYNISSTKESWRP
jgi:hypothetical protein